MHRGILEAMTSVLNRDAVLRMLHDRLPGMLAVHAFGSRIQGTAGPDSDLDLAVLVAGYAARTCYGIWLATWKRWRAARWICWTCVRRPR